MIDVTVWCEFIQEREDPKVAAVYPHGIHEAIAQGLRRESDLAVTTASLDQRDQGLPQERLDATDVLIWWGHKGHAQVDEATVDRVQLRANDGMGLILLHSSHVSKIMKRVLGTRCSLRHREIGERERVWNIEPNHPITQGCGRFIELPNAEMYGEFFDIPDPDELLFVSWFEGGEVFRSGAVWRRGQGRVFYFRPGHETYPIYHNPQVLRVLVNGVRWCAFAGNDRMVSIGQAPNQKEPFEELSPKDYVVGALRHPPAPGSPAGGAQA